ncbi:MAG: Mbov_0395 family pilin-like conjugal transfer protein [Patescibacteria group bacterium]
MKKILFLLLFLPFLLIGTTAQAGPLTNGTVMKNNADQVGNAAGFDNTTSLIDVIQIVIVTLLGLLAIIFIGLMIYSGFKWMTAAGDADDIKKAKSTIISSIIGLILVLSSYAITFFIFNNLPFTGTAPQGGSNTLPNSGGGI